MQLKVEKSDGSSEVYLHTKVMGTIAAALAEGGCYEEGCPEQLAEAVTTFLKRSCRKGSVGSDEIHSMIEVSLCETGYIEAALVLHEYRVNRQIKRKRIEVLHTCRSGRNTFDQIHEEPDSSETDTIEPWDKSVIARDLEKNRALPRNLARAIAGAVEEKILRLDCRQLSSALVRELVENELLSMKRAEQALFQQNRQEKLISVDRVRKENAHGKLQPIMQ